MTQEKIANSWIESEQFLLLVLRTAWGIDEHQDYRKDISAVKVAIPTVLANIAQRAMQLHGALGVSDELPLASMVQLVGVMGIVDGPTEVRKVVVAREPLKGYAPVDGPWPSAHLPTRREAAQVKYVEPLEHRARSRRREAGRARRVKPESRTLDSGDIANGIRGQSPAHVDHQGSRVPH